MTKTSLVSSKHKAFKKMPDRLLGEVIMRKQTRREESQSRVKDTTPEYPNIYSAEIFDTPYIRALHKRTIMFQLRYRADAKGWKRYAKTSRLIRTHERKEAARWREAILRDAPLLRGFFAEEPKWRNRMLHWCEKTLSSTDDSGKA